MSNQEGIPMEWRRLETLCEMLEFCAGKVLAGEAANDWTVGRELAHRLGGDGFGSECHIQHFTDGSAVAVISDQERGWYDESYLRFGYFAADGTSLGALEKTP